LPTTSDVVTVAAIVTGSGAAAGIDLATRRIPNGLTVALAALGITLASAGVSGVSLGGATIGFALGLLLMLPGHALGATGAGDVKLFAALGTWLGPAGILLAFVYTALAGGVLALAVAGWRGQLGPTLGRTARLLHAPAAARHDIESSAGRNVFPYGPAIAIGSVLAVLFGG
jgi:prepilin peptidase CpaA